MSGDCINKDMLVPIEEREVYDSLHGTGINLLFHCYFFRYQNNGVVLKDLFKYGFYIFSLIVLRGADHYSNLMMPLESLNRD